MSTQKKLLSFFTVRHEKNNPPVIKNIDPNISIEVFEQEENLTVMAVYNIIQVPIKKPPKQKIVIDTSK